MDLNGDFLSSPGLCPFAKASYTIALHASEHGKFWHGALQLLQDMKALASQNQQNNAAGLMFNMGETVWPASMNFHLGLASELRPRTHPMSSSTLRQVAAVQPELADFRMVARPGMSSCVLSHLESAFR